MGIVQYFIYGSSKEEEKQKYGWYIKDGFEYESQFPEIVYCGEDGENKAIKKAIEKNIKAIQFIMKIRKEIKDGKKINVNYYEEVKDYKDFIGYKILTDLSKSESERLKEYINHPKLKYENYDVKRVKIM